MNSKYKDFLVGVSTTTIYIPYALTYFLCNYNNKKRSLGFDFGIVTGLGLDLLQLNFYINHPESWKIITSTNIASFAYEFALKPFRRGLSKKLEELQDSNINE